MTQKYQQKGNDVEKCQNLKNFIQFKSQNPIWQWNCTWFCAINNFFKNWSYVYFIMIIGEWRPAAYRFIWWTNAQYIFRKQRYITNHKYQESTSRIQCLIQSFSCKNWVDNIYFITPLHVCFLTLENKRPWDHISWTLRMI